MAALRVIAVLCAATVLLAACGGSSKTAGVKGHSEVTAQPVSKPVANPAKADAWAATLHIQTTEIRRYVSRLTAATLRTDTRVTNHGYVNGQANPLQAVLQAGTAVFVDKYGEPVVKCYCGNPLTPPIAYSAPVYTGPVWTGFQTTNITIIEISTTIINIFTLYDPSNGKYFTHPAGIDFS